MSVRTVRIIPIVMLFAMASMSISCTLFFTVIGADKDQARARKPVTLLQDPAAIPRGKSVYVITVEGDTVKGTNQGLVERLDSAYTGENANELSVLDSTVDVPSLKDSLFLMQQSGKAVPCTFEGFSRGILSVNAGEPPRLYKIRLNGITQLTNRQGKPYDLSQWSESRISPRLPKYLCLAVNSGEHQSEVPLDRIDHIVSPPSRTNYWALGLGVGLITDAALLAAIARAYTTAR